MHPDAERAPTKPRPVRGFVRFRWRAALGWAARHWTVLKWSVYALLAGNVALYALEGSPTESIDTGAWVLLLLLFEWETGGWRLPAWSRPAVRGLRALAGLVVVWACVDYALAGERLDFANALTWLAVIVALELELRVAADRRRFHRVRQLVAKGLYLALAGFALAWWGLAAAGVPEAWLDAWDATLWLAAFAAIELNVFGLAGSARGRPPAGAVPPRP